MKNKLIIACLLCLPMLTWAHGYWLEVAGATTKGSPVTVKIFYGEYASQIREEGDKLDKMSDIKVSVIAPDGSKKDLTMTQTKTHWEGIYTPTSDGCYQVVGINDTREVQDWAKHKLGVTRPIQYLRTQFTIGNPEQATTHDAPLFLDVRSQINTNNIELYAVKDGKPMNKTKVRVVNPDGWLQDKFSNAVGFVNVIPNKDGLYMVEIEWIDPNPGVFKGKNYETVRHKCALTFTSKDMSIKF
ncbi:MAG: DUF4198 domain-containing protein [Saprospiraceae bacterium]|nr:DUF4198 domain-containing protein [Saprospiraceae bacterium]